MEADGSVSNLWKAYEFAQKHYDADLALFTNRMNLFLVIQSALIAVAAGFISGTRSVPTHIQHAVSGFGLTRSMAWLLTAISSYRWIKVWRRHMMGLGIQVEVATGIVPSSTLFSVDRRRRALRNCEERELFADSFSWYVRPTFIISSMPVVYATGWIYLGWFL